MQKKKVIRISRQPSAIQIRIDQKQQQNVEDFIWVYWCSLIKNDERRTLEVKSGIALAKTTFFKKKTFHQPIGLKFKKWTTSIGEQLCMVLELDTSECGSKISRKCSKVVLEKDGED